MILGIPKELKDHEKRVALLPEDVARLVRKRHQVLVQRGAGQGCGYGDADYRKAGATMVASTRAVYQKSQLVLKVKEPIPQEYGFFRKGLWLFCFLHLAANRPLTRALVRSGVTALGFETLQDAQGQTPLLKPMSEIAGRLSTLLGAHYLRSDQGGKGVLLSPITGVLPGRVMVIGGGNVGRSAAEVAVGLGASVQVLDHHLAHLRKWQRDFPQVKLIQSSSRNITQALRRADLVVGAVSIPGAKTPQVIRRSMVQQMEKKSVLVDVAVDQGGASETTHPTTLSNPIYTRYGVIHCAVTNLPALVSRSATQALSKVLLPYVFKVTKKKDPKELMKDAELVSAVNVSGGRVVHPKIGY